jgi:phosphatidylserine decarboxylase
MDIIIIILSTILLSTGLFIFWVVKGGFNKKYLYTDNILLSVSGSAINVGIYTLLKVPLWIISPVICGLVVLLLFFGLFFYRFFRNPERKIHGNCNDIVSAADGRVIYIKELEKNQIPITIKKLRISTLSEITKTDLLEQPCYLIGIAMTLFDVHYNRSPIDGKIVLIKHTPGTSIGLNTPISTISNERNTVVIKRDDCITAGIVQIAARGVNRCIVTVSEGDAVSRGQVIGKIRWGSQLDMIIPRNSEIFVREGEQVFAGETIIGRYLGD